MKFLTTVIMSLVLCFPTVANDLIDSLTQELQSTTTSTQRGVLQIALSKAYQRVDLAKSKQYAQLALNSISDIDSLEVQALDLIARSYFYQSKLDSALIFFKAEEEVFQRNNQEDKVAAINISIGSVLLRKGAFEEAVRSFISSLSYFEEVGDEGSAAKCYTNLGTAFAELDDYPSAINYGLQALPIVRKLKMLQVEMILLPNLATQHLKNNDEDNALKYYKEAEVLALANNGKRSLALIYNNLGDLYLTNENYNLAESYINKAIEVKKELNQSKGLEESYFNLGLIHYKRGNYKSALELYNQSVGSAQGLDRVKILYALKDVHRVLGNNVSALSYSEEARILADSLNRSESIATISELDAKYNVAKKENEILKLTTQNQDLELTKIRSRFWTLLLGGAFVIAIIVLILNRRSAMRKRKYLAQRHELEQQKMLDRINLHEQQVIEKMIIGQEEERKRIAGDLHDSLGSKLSTLKRYIEKISISQDREAGTIQTAMAIADDSYTEVRKIAHEMNSGMLVEHGLLPALEDMVQNKSKAHDIEIGLHIHDMEGRLKNHIEIQVFRIIQELTNNVIKHASATTIDIQLTRFIDYLNIIVEDNGTGFDVGKAGRGMGLKGIDRRLNRLDGTVNIDSSKLAGTTAIIEIPI